MMADDGWCGGGWLGSHLINLQTDSGMREREREGGSGIKAVHKENRDRDRNDDSHTQAVSVFLSQPSGHIRRHTAGVSKKIKNLRHAESQRLVSDSVEQSQVSVYRLWRDGGMGWSLKGGWMTVLWVGGRQEGTLWSFFSLTCCRVSWNWDVFCSTKLNHQYSCFQWKNNHATADRYIKLNPERNTCQKGAT